MRIYNSFIVNQFDTLSDGNSGANLPVAVRLPSTGEKATLYDEEGQEIDNPVMSGPAGNYSFYIDEGFYNIIENEGAESAFTKFNEPILGGAGASLEEEVILDDTQIDVVFSQVNTFASLFFIQGQNVDRGLLNEGADQDYTIINSSTIRLTSSRPAGSSIKAYDSIEALDGEVISVFGRVGNVVAVDGDYSATDVIYDPNSSSLTSIRVQSAIDELDAISGNLTTQIENLQTDSHTHNNNAVIDLITDAGSGSIITDAERILFNNSIQPGDNVSELINDAGYLLSGDDISLMNNNLGFITLADIPADAVVSVNGKSGIVVLSKDDVGLDQVDNTSDVNKPVSTATQSALDSKANSSQVQTDVPVGAVFTDTTYSVQNGELSEINFTTVYKDKLDSIEDNANNYSHPINHPASIIQQDSNNRFVTDAEKAAWNAGADADNALTLGNQPPEYYATKAEVDAAQAAADDAALLALGVR